MSGTQRHGSLAFWCTKAPASRVSRVPTPIQLWLLLFRLPCSLEAFWCWENGGEMVAQRKNILLGKASKYRNYGKHSLPSKYHEISIFQSYMIVTEQTASQRFVIRFTLLCQHSWKAVEKSGPALLLKTGSFWSHCVASCVAGHAWRECSGNADIKTSGLCEFFCSLEPDSL